MRARLGAVWSVGQARVGSALYCRSISFPETSGSGYVHVKVVTLEVFRVCSIMNLNHERSLTARFKWNLPCIFLK